MSDLTDLFTDIADAIRSKKGTQELINAEDFPDEIEEMQTGELTSEEYDEAIDDVDDILENTVVPSNTINITQNGLSNVASYANANVNVVSEYNVKATGENLGSVTSARFTDYIIEIRDLTLGSSVTSLLSFFSGFAHMVTAPQMDTSNITVMTYMFEDCRSLVNVPIYDTSKVTVMNYMFEYCQNLSTQSLNNILAMCANAPIKTSSNKKLSMLGFSQAYANICVTLSNWPACEAAGWTTGY